MAGTPADALGLDSQRIRHLTGAGAQDSRITIVGLGSGGFPVMQHLAMSGWRKFTLIDPDKLEAVNLVKHPGFRKDQGRLKVDIAAEWLSDRNPRSELEVHPRDIRDLDEVEMNRLAEESDLVVSATDSNSIRHLINELCVRTETTMTIGLVHRGGTGGTVMAFRPGISGCYACLESVAEGLEGSPTDGDYPQSQEEQEMVYGRGVRGYAAAGLSADIAIVSAIHAQASIAQLLELEQAPGSAVPPLHASWMAIRIRLAGLWEWQTRPNSICPGSTTVYAAAASRSEEP